MNYLPRSIIGGNRGLSGQAPFAEASLIVTDAQNLAAIIPTDSPDTPECLTDEDFTHLLEKQEAFKLRKPQEYRPGLTLWMFRRSDQVFKDQLARLKTRGALVHAETQKQVDILVIDGPRSIPSRDDWIMDLYSEAWTAAANNDWEHALRTIELVWLLERHHAPIPTAFYSLALERMNRQAEADAILTIEANSGFHRLDELENTVTALAKRLGAGAGLKGSKGKGRRSSRSSRMNKESKTGRMNEGSDADNVHHMFREDRQPAFSFDATAAP